MQGHVPFGTLVSWLSYHGTARTLSSCTVLCKVSSLSGRWSLGCLIMALRGLCSLVPCYARSRPCRDAGLLVVLSWHCEDYVLLYRVMQGRVPVGTLADRLSYHGTARTSSSCTVLCKVTSLSGRPLVSWLSYHGTARTLSSCTVLCKVASLSGRWPNGCLITALRGLRPLVPCYARSRP